MKGWDGFRNDRQELRVEVVRACATAESPTACAKSVEAAVKVVK